MTLPLTSDSLGNVLRLKGLKNVNGRRRVSGAPDVLESLAPEDVDVSGTQNEEHNVPMPDMEGGLVPESYDVRANEVIHPEVPQPAEEENVYTQIGRSLGSQFVQSQPPETPPPVETRQVEAAEGLPNQAPPEQAESPGFWGSIGKALKEYIQPFGTVDHFMGRGTPETRQMMEDAQLRAQGVNPDQRRAEQAQEQQLQQAEFKAQIDQAQQNPMEYVVYGATDAAANMPEIKKQIETITGTDFSPMIQEQTRQYEKVLSDLENNNNQAMASYDEQLNRIKQRIETNSATDMDKYYIGLALLMPLLAGAIFGKEAALGALGGGFKGLSDVYRERGKNIREDESAISELEKIKANTDLKRGELELEKLKLPGTIQKNLPKDEREHLKGKSEVTWTDPETGKQRIGIQIKPGLIAYDEYVTDKDELKEMRKEASDLETGLTATRQINKITKNIIDLSSKLKDKSALGKAFNSYILNKDPSIASQLGEEVNFEGRKVNSAVALTFQIKALVDAYRQVKGMRALTGTVQDHIEGMLQNPAASFQTPKDTIDQMLYMRNLAQAQLMNNAKGLGFAPEFLMEEIGKENKDVYNQLNYAEGEKLSSQLLRE